MSLGTQQTFALFDVVDPCARAGAACREAPAGAARVGRRADV